MGNSVPPGRGKSTEVQIKENSLDAALQQLEDLYFKPLGISISDID